MTNDQITEARNVDIESLHWLGSRPKWDDVTLEDEDYKKKYAHGLNWANYALSYDDYKAETLKYVKTINFDEATIINAKPQRFINAGKICALINDGCPVTDKTLAYLNTQLETLKIQSVDDIAVQEDEAPKKPKTEIKRINDVKRTLDLQSKVDDVIDEIVVSNISDSVYGLLIREKAEPRIVRGLRQYYKDHFNALHKELESLREDATLEADEKEKYEEDITLHIMTVKTALNEINSYLGNKRAARSGKKQKTFKELKKAQKVIKTAKYKTYDKEFKIQSVEVDKVLGTQLLLAFNTKNRKLSYYYAADENGLDIKGTTIMNYSKELSKQKTIRQPERVLTDLQRHDDHRAKIVYKELTTKESKPNGRLNNHIILLKAWKKLTNINLKM